MKYSCRLSITNLNYYFKTACLLLLIAFLSITSTPAFAQWSSSPSVNIPLCTAANEQNIPLMISDGAGGAFIAWYYLRNGADYNIYAQHLNAAGVADGMANGKKVCSEPAKHGGTKKNFYGTGRLVIFFDCK